MFIFSILKFIFFVFIFFVILGILAVLFLKRAVKKATKNFGNQFNEKQQPQDTTTFQNKNQSKNSANYKDKGEYIDFEEIK